jgi:multiple sugar transport system substrate-binding protein
MKPLYFGAKVYSDDTWTNGGRPGECYFNSPEYIKATQRLNDLVYVDKVSPTPAISQGLAGENREIPSWQGELPWQLPVHGRYTA